MPKVWNIGNTTVRNPKRIENALKVFVAEGFSGNAKGAEQEQRLHQMLKEHGILEFDGDASDLNGRKWRAAFYQLGFISFEEYKIGDTKLGVAELFQKLNQLEINKPYQLTQAGRSLIDAITVPEIEEIYTRQFVCYEIPSSLEGSFPEGKMKPFILLLQVLLELQNKNLAGLNKFEVGFFIQPFQEHDSTLTNKIVEAVVKYRDGLKSLKETKSIKEYNSKYLNTLAEISGINPLSVVGDYSDTTFRYFGLSGLFSRVGESIIIRNNKLDFVRELIKTEPKFLFDENPFEYFKHFYSNSFPLPIDQKEFAITEIKTLLQGVKIKNERLNKIASSIGQNTAMEDLKELRYYLIIYNSFEREQEYALLQRSEKSIEEIVKYLRTLNNESVPDKPDIDDKPAFLEWAVWRGFLAINDIVCKIHETRRFPIDQDFMPRNTAPGGGSDLIFEFEDYVLAVEVTLTTSHRQMAVESEPVRRHTVQYRDIFPAKDIYCLFISPEVDNNVAETFRIGVWYKKDKEEFINIIPMSLSDFTKTISVLLKRKYQNHDFRNLLDKCLVSRNVRAPQWKQSISREVDEWVRKLSVVK